ncbi:hypothetical protein MMC11_007708 [Xylographa trunciseda]|nr:hypothetical protein [Xylographa trunciseda]
MEKTRSRFVDAWQRRKSWGRWSSDTRPASRRSSESRVCSNTPLSRSRMTERPSTAGSFSTSSELEGGSYLSEGFDDLAFSQVDSSLPSHIKPPIPYYDFQSEQWEDARSDAVRLTRLIYSSPSEEIIGPFGSYYWDIQSIYDGEYNTEPYSQIIVPSHPTSESRARGPNLIYERHSHKCIIWIEWYDSRITVSNLPRICFFPAG